MSQAQLAERCGVSARSVRGWENGDYMPERPKPKAALITLWNHAQMGDAPDFLSSVSRPAARSLDTDAVEAPPQPAQPPEKAGKRSKYVMSPQGKRCPVIDYSAVRYLRQVGCQSDEIAAVIGISSYEYKQRLSWDPALAESMERGELLLKVSLRRAIFDVALNRKHPQMLMFLGKQHLGYADRVALDADLGVEARLKIADESEAARIIAKIAPHYQSLRSQLATAADYQIEDQPVLDVAEAGVAAISETSSAENKDIDS